MTNMVIRAEADTLDNARGQLKALIPEGSYLIAIKVVSEGKPVIKNCKDIIIEADSIEDAKKLIESRVPEGYQVTSEVVLSQGATGTVAAEGYTEDYAYPHAKDKVPKGGVVVSKKVIVPSQIKTVSVMAFDEESARHKALKQFPGTRAVFFGIHILSEGSKGILGIGKKPNSYSVKVAIRLCKVEIKYFIKAKIKLAIAKIAKPLVAVEGTIVNGVDNLLDAMRALAKNKDGLWDFTPGKFSDRYCILEAMEGLDDDRVPGVLFDYVRCHIADASVRRDTMDKNKCDAVVRVIKSLEKIQALSVRGEMIELIFEQVLSFQYLYVPDLFGKFTEILRAFVAVFTPIVVSNKQGALDNDGYEVLFEYNTFPLESALKSLCAIKNPVSSNLLFKLASLPKILMPLGDSDKGLSDEKDPTERINLRQRARNEIVLRTSPPYDIYDFNAYRVDENYK